jgi:tight adherence protein C
MALALAFLGFLLITALVMSAYYTLTTESPIAERLRAVGAAQTSDGRRKQAEAPAFLWLSNLLAGIGKFGFGGDEKSLSNMLSVAGYRGPNATVLFLGVRTIVSFGPAILLIITQIAAGKPLSTALLYAFFALLFGHALCNYMMRRRARKRIVILRGSLPDALDLMVVSLEAGLGLNATIERVAEERSAMNDPLGFEFSSVSRELREGRGREEALRALGERNGVDDLKSLSALIIQSDRLGASMAKTLRSHADVLRTKRRQRAEEEARKLPVKMLFPLAFFILPALFVVAVGPAMLRLGKLFDQIGGRGG